MCVVYLMQMVPVHTGGLYHELAGIAFVALFVTHHLLNRGWFGRAVRSRGVVGRVNAVLDVALAVCVAGVAVSGVLMSKEVLPAISQPSLAHLMRPFHACLSYVGLIVVSVHVGMHVPILRGYAHLGGGAGKPWPVWARALLAVGCIAFGFIAWVRLDVTTKLTMGMSFADGVTPLPVLLLWHMALAAPFVACGSMMGTGLSSSEKARRLQK